MKPRVHCRRILWVLIAAALLLGIRPVAATAGSLSLAWDPNTEDDLAGVDIERKYSGIRRSVRQ